MPDGKMLKVVQKLWPFLFLSCCCGVVSVSDTIEATIYSAENSLSEDIPLQGSDIWKGGRRLLKRRHKDDSMVQDTVESVLPSTPSLAFLKEEKLQKQRAVEAVPDVPRILKPRMPSSATGLDLRDLPPVGSPQRGGLNIRIIRQVPMPLVSSWHPAFEFRPLPKDTAPLGRDSWNDMTSPNTSYVTGMYEMTQTHRKFFIQSVTRKEQKQTSGGDIWAVTLRSYLPPIIFRPPIEDLLDGRYEVDLSDALPGHYEVNITLLYAVTDIPWHGPLVVNFDTWNAHLVCSTGKLRMMTLVLEFFQDENVEWLQAGNRLCPSPLSLQKLVYDAAGNLLTQNVIESNPPPEDSPSFISLNSANFDFINNPHGSFVRRLSCSPPYCTGDMGTLRTQLMVFKPAKCHYHLFTNYEAKRCMSGLKLLFMGDSLNSVLFSMLGSFLYELPDNMVFFDPYHISIPELSIEIRYVQWKFDYMYNDTSTPMSSNFQFHRNWADLIFVNSGMHDLAQINLWEKEFGVRQRHHPQLEYRTALKDFVKMFENDLPKMVWLTTTSSRIEENMMDCWGNFCRWDRIQLFNRFANEIMVTAGVPVLDMYSVYHGMEREWFVDALHPKCSRANRDDLQHMAEPWLKQSEEHRGHRNENMILQVFLNNVCGAFKNEPQAFFPHVYKSAQAPNTFGV